SIPHASISYHPPSASSTYTLSLHDALPILPCEENQHEITRMCSTVLVGNRSNACAGQSCPRRDEACHRGYQKRAGPEHWHCDTKDRKSTRLNSSHVAISYAVFCLKKKRDKT